jgi:pimeloyl-ACP methyl ester carboxylesterase
VEGSTVNPKDQYPLVDQFSAFRRDYPYRQISYSGTVWPYRAGGATDRPTVLVLPGATMVPDPLFVVIHALGRQYRVIAPAYPSFSTMADLVAGVTAILDTEQVSTVHVVGSSFGGYLAQCLVRANRQRIDSLVLAQSGIRHFIGPVPLAVLHAVLRVAPVRLVRSFTWRTWKTLLADIGPEQQFWMAMLRDILDHQLTKSHLVAVIAAIGDFAAHYRPVPGDLVGWERPVLVLHSEHDRAFASQADDIRAVYPTAAFQVLACAGHGALFTHTDQYIDRLLVFLADLTDPGGGHLARSDDEHNET